MKIGILSNFLLTSLLLLFSMFPMDVFGQKKKVDTALLTRLLNNSPSLDSFVKNKEALGIQVIYTQIDRSKKGKARFTDYSYNVDGDNYFYPASTVKLPVAILALQKLNELKITGLDRNSTMITGAAEDGQTEVSNDPSAGDGRPTIAHYIKKILLVSDNDAFNRLYEFLGQEYINNSLQKMGFTETQIVHRLSISLTEEQNRHTNPVRFYDTAGKLLYEKPAVRSQLQYAKRDTKLGKGYMKGATLINEPFDFSQKNRLSLSSLHSVVKAILFPQDVPEQQRFNLTNDDYDFLRKYMSMRPGESVSPVYPSPAYWDNYVKMIFYGAEKTNPEPGIRIFNKTGTAYGYLIESAYIADFGNNVEWILSAVIYCNSDGIFNDDKYDYQQTGYPFLKQLGRIIYDHELKRTRKHTPGLSTFRYDYTR